LCKCNKLIRNSDLSAFLLKILTICKIIIFGFAFSLAPEPIKRGQGIEVQKGKGLKSGKKDFPKLK
jgi:hypothetical protein